MCIRDSKTLLQICRVRIRGTATQRQIAKTLVYSATETQPPDSEATEIDNKNETRKSKVCLLGRLCKRTQCLYEHPRGRFIDGCPHQVAGKFGTQWQAGIKSIADKSITDNFILYLDELDISNRPILPPSKMDCEVFIDPLPNDSGSAELKDFLDNFGKVFSVCQLQRKNIGYVRFVEHEAAKSCVKTSVHVCGVSLNVPSVLISECQEGLRKRLLIRAHFCNVSWASMMVGTWCVKN